MAPVVVERTGPLLLSVQEQNRRIDFCVELVWTDEIQTIGGVRFTTLNAEARDQILDWVRKSEAVAGQRSTLGSTLLKAFRGSDSRRFARSFKPALWWNSSRRLKVSGFVRGLATGFLLSLVAFSIVLFSYRHRRELGESLIRLGERLVATRDSETTLRVVPTVPVPVSSPATDRTITPVEAKPSTARTPSKNGRAQVGERPLAATVARVRMPAPKNFQRTDPMSTQSNSGPVKPRETSLSDAKGSASGPGLPMPGTAKLANPSVSLSPVKEAPPPSAKPEQLVASTHREPAAPLSIGFSPLSSSSNVQLFFDVGRFKKEWLAQDASNKIAQLGIHATVVPRGHLWTSSYHVLAGPYDNEIAETQIKKELLSHGFKPRPYERGTRDFMFRSRVMIDRYQLPTGDFTIAWESYIADAKVKFTQDRYLLAAADGKWVKCPAKFMNNEYVYRNQADGSRTLLEVHFAGMDRALVFRDLR
jgi:hypothetical protein